MKVPLRPFFSIAFQTCNVVTLKLLPSASWPLEHAFSARKPLRIFCYMLSVSMNYFISGSTSH